jgi:transcriptional regulator with XRE-family HTH domain
VVDTDVDAWKELQAGLGQRVYELRSALEYDQLALARMAGYKNANVISDMEKGKYNPTLKKLHALAKALHTSEAYLLTGQHTALDLATLKRLLDAELSEMTVHNAEMSKRLQITLALIATCA